MINTVVPRLAIWLDDELSPRRLLPLVLLLVGLIGVTLGLAELVRGFDLSLFLPMVIFGLLLGWGLAASPWPDWVAGSLSLILSVVAIFGRIGQLLGVLVVLLGTLLDLAWKVLRWPFDGPPDGTPALLALTELWGGINILLSRLVEWALGLATDQPVFDPVAVDLVWSLAVWSVAAWAGWMVRRRDQPLLGLLPAGALLVISQAYGGRSFHFLLLLLGLTWLLLALVGHTARERRWQATEIDYSLDIRLDLAWVALLLSLALVVVAGITPSLSVQQVTRFAQRLIWGHPPQAGPVAHSFGLNPPPPPPTVLDEVWIGGLPRRHLLGSGPELSQQVVMMIRAAPAGSLSGGALHFQFSDGVEPTRGGQSETSYPQGAFGSGQDRRATPLNYYWRSLTYDRYTGQGWLTSGAKTLAYEAGEPVPSPSSEEVFETSEVSPSVSEVSQVQQEVQVVGDLGGLLHMAGTLVTVDQPYQVAWRSPGDAFGATVAATTYQAASLLPVASEAQLRTAVRIYPEWVRQRYLALPDEVPRRVLALARDLTATAPTPYDGAQAIEAYLRAFPYDLKLPAPPANRDVVDYFLFDLQRGYCDYYATSMVVLARAAGLPARLVVGYASGTYDSTNGRYLVTEADAHSWPELYFPGYGWIEFEPTANRPAVGRPAEVRPILPPELTAPASEPGVTPHPGLSYPWRWSLVAGLAGLTLVGLVWAAADLWWLRRLAPATTVERLYLRLQRYGRWLAVPTWAGETPYEFSATLAGRVADLTQVRRWAGILAPTVQEVYWLTALYVQVVYSVHPPDTRDQLQAIRIWRRLRWRLWLAYVCLTFERLKVSRLIR